jgi:superfamily II DNA or RNA helicase
MSSDADSGWDINSAIRLLRGTMDPYLWQQGQELYSRGAVEDFAIQASGDIQVRVLDPRDARIFHVLITKDSQGRIRAICRCPYQLSGHCRHQVVAFEYLKAVSTGEIDPTASTEEKSDEVVAPSGSVLYRLFDASGSVSTQTDGSLLRVVLQSLGSSRTPHRASLHLYTGSGWTALRTADVDRWIGRGAKGAHARDRVLTNHFLDDGVLRTEIDSDTLSAVLAVVASSEAIVDRSGTALIVRRTPWRLVARVVEGDEHALGVELACRSPSGEELPFDEVLLVPAIAPWIQLDSGELAPLEAGVGGALLEELQEEDLSSIAPEDLDRFLSEGLGALDRLCVGDVESTENLISDVEGVEAARVRLKGSPERLEGVLELRYGDEWVEAPASPEPWTIERDGKVVRYPPAGQSMARAQRELEGIGLFREAGVWILEGAQSLARLLTPRTRPFVSFELPSRLRALDLVDRPPLLRLSVRPGAGWRSRGGAGDGPSDEKTGAAGGGRYSVDWFEVDFQLLDDGRELAVDLPALCKAAVENPGGVLQLDDGTVLGLGHDSVATLFDLARRGDAASVKGASLSVGLPSLAELIDDVPGRELEFDRELLELSSALRSGEGLPVPALGGHFDEVLRPYQKDAVRWFGGLARWGVSGILADEMGLGKTVMALGHLFGRAGEEAESTGPVLIVCPTSLIFNWVDECKKFCPDVDVVGLAGLSPTEREELILEEHQLLVTSFALLRRDREVLESREFRAVVLDEGQHIKNATSQTAKAAFAVRARERWILTGTPLENHLGELWSLYHFLMPGFLGGAKEFQKQFADPIRHGDDDARAALRSRVRPFLLRRTKEQVLTELPPCIEQVERVPLSAEQQTLYARQLAEARADIDSDTSEKSRFRVLAALTRLRQICCDPRLIDKEGESSAPGAKFELLLELLDECVEEEHRVLLFSQFTSMLDLIEARLDEIGMRYCRLDGSTRDRRGEVSRFVNDPKIPVFLISLKAGGHGLNLTAADTVILYDPWWNPAVEDQAAARAHRMGQTVPVHVHKLVAAGTVEEKILELQAQKRDLAQSVIDGDEDGLSGLDIETLRGLVLDV